MVIDVHVHPNGYPQVAQDPASRAFRDRVFQRRPQDALSAPIAMTGKPSGGNGGGNKNFDVLFTRMDHEGIDRFVLLPMDLTTRYGGWVVSNDEIEQIVAAAPNRFIGFASVDPYRPDALEVLDHAFKNQKLAGLKLHPSKQAFYPDDPMMDAIYKKCLEYNKPIMFHAGMSWEPDCLIKYSRPVNFEGVAVKYPEAAHLPGPLRLALGGGNGHAVLKIPQRLHRHGYCSHGFSGSILPPYLYPRVGAHLVRA